MRMRVDYAAEAVHLDLSNRPIEDSAEVADGIIFDYDADGQVVGIEILGSAKEPRKSKASDMPHVDSSMMTRVEYDDGTSELDITFSSGKTYRYFEVAPDVYCGLLDSESKGEFFNEHIRDIYRHAEVVRQHR
jgi:lysyl-tRNA synthetase class 2